MKFIHQSYPSMGLKAFEQWDEKWDPSITAKDLITLFVLTASEHEFIHNESNIPWIKLFIEHCKDLKSLEERISVLDKIFDKLDLQTTPMIETPISPNGKILSNKFEFFKEMTSKCGYCNFTQKWKKCLLICTKCEQFICKKCKKEGNHIKYCNVLYKINQWKNSIK